MIVKKWMLCLLLAALLALAAGTALATTENLWVTVDYDQDGAREMLDEVNAFRTGSDAWYWSGENVKQSVTGLSMLNYDYFLEQVAMQLAVECAFDASGNRTDGSHYMTLVNGQGYSYSAYGSCRGSGKATASEMLAQMLADDTGYYSQRCRDLLLKDYYNCMGVGHAQFNDNDYWVLILCKSNDGKGYTPTTAVNSYKEVKVPFDLDSDTIGINVTLTDAPEVLELYMTDIGVNGKATQLPTHMAVQLYNKGSTPAVYKPGLVKLKLPYPVWTVSGDCVKINPNNTQSLLPLKQGEGIASTTVLGNKLNVNVAVVPRDIKDALVSAPDQVFDGTPKKPGPIVLLDGVQLKEGAEDTNDVEVVGRTNNMYPGTATVTVAGKGKYKGEATGTYRILPANLSLVSVSAPSVTYTGAAQTPGFEATYMGMTLIQGTDYDIAYSNNTNAGTGAVTLTGKGYYTGTLNESFAINPASLASAEWTDIPAQTWTGAALTPALSLSFNGVALAAGTDYDAAWSNNTNLGKASVTLTGKGNFAGSLTKEFNIVAANLSGASIADIPAQDYTGAAIEPALTVKLGSATLKAGTDYTVSYANNTNAGTATATITGVGNYTGTASKSFTINAPASEVPTTPTDPGTTPSDPGTTPADPGTTPTDPGTTPTDPGTTPSDPGTSAEQQPTGPVPGSRTVDKGKYTINPDGTARYDKPAKSAATVTIPDVIDVDGFSVPVTSIADKAFYKNKKLKTITIGKNIKTIGKSAFASCAKLKTVKGGTGVVTIKASAFKGSKKLTAITLNKKVKTIGKNAFYGCKALKTVTIKTTKLTSKTVGANAFKGIASKATFKCPSKKLKDYKKLLKKKGAPGKAKYKK